MFRSSPTPLLKPAAYIACTLLAACALMPSTRPLDPSRFAAIDTAINAYIDKRQVPGASFWLEREGMHYANGFGRQTFDADAAGITPDTVFDAASLTKVVVTAPAVMLLIDAGKLKLDAALTDYIPECTGGGKEAITLRHLLTHSSGLNSGLPARPAWQGKANALRLACAQTVTHAPGTFFRYSDINFILLGLIVERVSGEPLDVFAAKRIFAPLGMTKSGYMPLARINAAEIAPTQKSAAQPGTSLHWDLPTSHELRGVVHDPTARFMGGVGGHAGLFTTVRDLARYARMLLNDGELDGKRLLSKESVALMRTVQSPDAIHYRRSAGWDIETTFSRPRGKLFPVGSFGHTGFTGCILWIDPFSKTFVAFLSNRVYPNDKGMILPLYTELGTLSAEAVTGFDFGKVEGALTPRQPLAQATP